MSRIVKKTLSIPEQQKAAWKLVKWMADNSTCRISRLGDCDCTWCVSHMIIYGRRPHTSDIDIWAPFEKGRKP